MATINSWEWVIDGITRSTDQVYTFEFNALGPHVIQLTVGDDEGAFSTRYSVVYVYGTGAIQNTWQWEIDSVLVSVNSSFNITLPYGDKIVKLTVGDTNENTAIRYCHIRVHPIFENDILYTWSINGEDIASGSIYEAIFSYGLKVVKLTAYLDYQITVRYCIVNVYITNRIGYRYDFDDGAISEISNPTHFFTVIKTHDVIATVYDYIQEYSEHFSIEVLRSIMSMYPPYKTDHAGEVKALFPEQFKKPLPSNPRAVLKLHDFMDALLTQVQSIEDTLQDIYVYTQLVNAVNAQLDEIGLLVGEPRNALNDTDYRRLILARIQYNNSSGTPNAILNYLIAFGFDPDMTTYAELPATVYITVNEPALVTQQLLIDLKKVLSGGIKLLFAQGTGEEPFTFVPEGGDVAYGLGFSDNGTGGGVFVSL
jgi:hypothetical protein